MRQHLFSLTAPDRASFMSMKSIIFSGLLIRLLWASYTAYLGVETGLEADAQNFYFQILAIVKTGNYVGLETGAALILNVTAFLLMPFGDVLFLACALACLMWWIAGNLFVVSLDLLRLTSRQKQWATLLFAFWPSAIPYTSIPLRESFQLCFVNLAVFGALSLMMNRTLSSWVFVIAGTFLAGMLHGGLAAFGLAVIALTVLFFSLTSGKKFSIFPFLAAGAVIVSMSYFSERLISTSSYDLSAGTLTTIQTYQEGGVSERARAAYKEEVVALNFFTAIVALPVGFFQYLFEPFPQRITTLADFALALENLLRLSILLSIPASFRRLTDPISRRVLVYLFSLYVAQEFIWSLGTLNWGTASRHHVPAMGLLMLISAHLWYFKADKRATKHRATPLSGRSVRL
jgi:hypothetical protein